MCVGIPMQIQVIESERFALAHGRGETIRLNTALVGEVAVGDWVLTFLGDAREKITFERAQEVNHALDLVQAAMLGLDTAQDVGFRLPSQMSVAELRALAGHTET